MNRAERRKAGIKGKEPVYTIREIDLEAMKQDAVAKAVDTAFFLMLAIPTMIIHDKFADLIPVKDKEPREVRFTDMVLDLYDTFQQGYVSLQDLKQCLLEEAGIDVTHLRVDK